MKRILITGMSGTGKSSVIEELGRRGYPAIDTDSEAWSEWTTDESGQPDWVWREDKITALLEQAHDAPLFVSGCKSNQGKFYLLFDHVVLLSAPLETLLHRVSTRQNNPYGKSDEERGQIISYFETVQPLLRASCDLEINAAHIDIQQVADELVRIAEE